MRRAERINAALAFLAVALLLNPLFGLASAQPVTPTALSLTVFADGVVAVTHELSVDPTAPRITVQLPGESLENVLVVNENDVVLDYSLQGSTLTVDTLGSSRVTITYTAGGLVSKTGQVWTLSLQAPVAVDIFLPQGAEILSLNAVPLEISEVAGEVLLTMPAGQVQIGYTIIPPVTPAPTPTPTPTPAPPPEPTPAPPPAAPPVRVVEGVATIAQPAQVGLRAGSRVSVEADAQLRVADSDVEVSIVRAVKVSVTPAEGARLGEPVKIALAASATVDISTPAAVEVTSPEAAKATIRLTPQTEAAVSVSAAPGVALPQPLRLEAAGPVTVSVLVPARVAVASDGVRVHVQHAIESATAVAASSLVLEFAEAKPVRVSFERVGVELRLAGSQGQSGKVEAALLKANPKPEVQPPAVEGAQVEFVRFLELEATVSTAEPVLVVARYSDEEVKAVAEGTLSLYLFDEPTNAWVKIPSTVDAKANTVTAEVPHLSFYSLAGTVLAAETPAATPTPEVTAPTPTLQPLPLAEQPVDPLLILVAVIVIVAVVAGLALRRKKR